MTRIIHSPELLDRNQSYAIYGYGGIGRFVRTKMEQLSLKIVAIIDDNNTESLCIRFEDFQATCIEKDQPTILICAANYSVLTANVEAAGFAYMIVDPTYTENENVFKRVSTQQKGDILLSANNNALNLLASNFNDIEPQTIAWLNGLSDNNSVLFDIGASTGCFSVYAAIEHTGQVFAFEPDIFNFSQIPVQHQANGERITHLEYFNLALGNSTSRRQLEMKNASAGAHCKLIKSPEDETEPDGINAFSQPTLMMKLDDTMRVFSLPAPTHLKIDVDGYEYHVLLGAIETLASESLKEILIELSDDEKNAPACIALLRKNGFTLKEKHAINELTAAPVAGVFNYLFVKEC